MCSATSASSSGGGWSKCESELLSVGAQKFGGDFESISKLFDDKTPDQCKRQLDHLAGNATAAASAAASSASNSAAAGGSIIPASGISQVAKLLFVTAKLASRNLISTEEKRILKSLAIRVSSNHAATTIIHSLSEVQ